MDEFDSLQEEYVKRKKDIIKGKGKHGRKRKVKNGKGKRSRKRKSAVPEADEPKPKLTAPVARMI
jgi:hypothetical protein